VASFGYDGDGKMVTATVGVTTTFYVGMCFEKMGTITHTYYYHAGKRIAMREGTALYWLLTDHLGSTAMLVSGTITGELRYKAYGQVRDSWGITTTTKYHFTGQREESTIGLYFYNARWYDPALGRFTQADTVVPQPGNPQTLNRYSYATNNPLRYTDPSGHALEDGYGILWRYTSGGSLRAINLFPPGAGHSDRDLTYFIVMQAQAMANSQEVKQLAKANRSVLNRRSTYARFSDLAGDGKRWDIKDEMRAQLGDSFRLCSRYECHWHEYSVAGNILYGGIANEAGFSTLEVRAGAGYAEARDPDNKDKRNFPSKAWPLAYLPLGRLPYLFDDPYDYQAVGMGMEMQKRYGADVTVPEFQSLLVDYQDRLAKGTPDQSPVMAGGWPYAPGDFDNR
jgi:RHS repeat-associated protein